MSMAGKSTQVCLPITMEQIPTGQIPDWLKAQYQRQVQDPRARDAGGSANILVIHPTESSRRAAISSLAGTAIDDGPIDLTHHHTLNSLISSLHVDLRRPRVLQANGVFDIILHEECKKSAKNLEFPLIHSLPSLEWGKVKTQDLAHLFHALSEESTGDWDGPGLENFRRILTKLSDKLGLIHPDLQLRSLVRELANLSLSDVPFGLSAVDGIIFLDHPPCLSPLRERLLSELARFLPIHILAHSGSHRLGAHGHVLDDVPPVRIASELPDWIPDHEPWQPSAEADDSAVIRVLCPSTNHSISTTQQLIEAAFSSDNPPEWTVVIDPAADAHHSKWKRMFDDLGVHLPHPSRPLIESPSVHWLLELAGLSHGEEAWSMSRLRAFAGQKTLRFRRDWLACEQHPSMGDWRPMADSDLLEEMARNFHILAGRGALNSWLFALSRKPRPSGYESLDSAAKRQEQTQWWLLALATRLRPLLSDLDKQALDNADFGIGCHSQETLPLPESAKTGDAWLNQVASHLLWQNWTESLDGEMNENIVGIQTLLESLLTLREQQEVLKQSISLSGREWTNSLKMLVDGLNLKGRGALDSPLKLLTPDAALGCRADLLIMTNLDTESWDLRPPSISGLSEHDRIELGVLPPDTKLRTARHSFQHLIHCADEVIIIDAALDEASQPAAPLAEWLASNPWQVNSPALLPAFISAEQINGLQGDINSKWGVIRIREIGEFLTSRPADVIEESGYYRTLITGSTTRDVKQRSGLKVHSARAPEIAPLNAASVTSSLDARLVEDRLYRQPRFGSEAVPYLATKRHGEVISINPLKLQPSSREPKVTIPRLSPEWPPIGLSLPKGKKALSPDPRPLSPAATDLPDHDLRTGFCDGPEDSTEVWSCSRLSQWIACPRKGWMSARLKADPAEDVDDDIDARTRGHLLHGAYADLLCDVLGMTEGVERTSLTPISIASSGESIGKLSARLLSFVDQRAPWLRGTDAIAQVRRISMLGMNLAQFEKALDEDEVTNLGGRFGRLLDSELKLAGCAPLAVEWTLPSSEDSAGVLLGLPENGEGVPNPIHLRGLIDRVELIPITENGEYVNPEGSEEVCPLDLDIADGWVAKRHVIIRDLKSLEGPKRGSAGDRHGREVLQGIQLALYARAWEVTHPGDRVVGVGIAEVGEATGHFIEADPDYSAAISALEIGSVTALTSTIFRRPDESPKAVDSNPFRAWMRHRLTSALRAAQKSDEGNVVPTPSTFACSWCSVKEACGLAPIVGGDKQWS